MEILEVVEFRITLQSHLIECFDYEALYGIEEKLGNLSGY